MSKISIYVEGLTEMVFVRQFLMNKFDWSSARIECYNVGDENISKELYHFGDKNAPRYYMIYNYQNDELVLSTIIDNYQQSIKENYTKVIGLRDVYSERYIDLIGRKYDADGIDGFISGMKSQVNEISNKGDLDICFAIMEIEAWMLGMDDVMRRIDPGMSFKLDTDPEKACVHPFSNLEKTYEDIGLSYSKHWNDIKNFIYKITKDDFQKLYDSRYCQSFNSFVDLII